VTDLVTTKTLSPTSQLTIEFDGRVRGVGSNSRENVTTVLLEAIENLFPVGFNLAVVDRYGPILRAWGGNACVVGEQIATTRSTRYDLASLSKVVATTTLAQWLVQNRHWKLSDRVSKWLPELARDELTLHHLITHTSGLVDHRPFFHLGRHPRAVRQAVFDEANVDGPPGDVLYSDLNFMLLGWAVEKCSGQPLDRLFRDVVAAPLNLRSTGYRRRARDRAHSAATELNGDQRLEPSLVWGDVHDGNAWSLGGVAGHAGLFAPANDMATFITALLNPRQHPVLKPGTISAMTRYQAGHQPDVRALGWRLEPESWGEWPADTYWHTGFTGTSLLVAPSAGVGIVLLANAIHPVRQMDRQEEYRSLIHRSVAMMVL
jgi:CubicO group peptidase (beta-lactamase class C family)